MNHLTQSLSEEWCHLVDFLTFNRQPINVSSLWQWQERQSHTARIFKWTLIEMRHQFRVREVNGHAKFYIWRNFQQFPASHSWEKWQKPPRMVFLADFSKLYGLFWPLRALLTSQDISEGLICRQKVGRIALRLKKFGLKNCCFLPKMVIWDILGWNDTFSI